MDPILKETVSDHICILNSAVSTMEVGNINKPSNGVHEENGILFWINRSGFPMDTCSWNRMWNHVTHTHPEGNVLTDKIRNNVNLPQVVVPQAPFSFPPCCSISVKLDHIQQYMTELQYNYTGTQFYEIRKKRPLASLMERAKQMIHNSLPIKCLESVILGIFLSNGMLGVERFPISFKSVYNGNVCHHVVLGIYSYGRYGAIGMSRRDDLMYKPLIYGRLTDLITEFKKCYINHGHDLRKICVGYPVSHDQHSYDLICWKGLMLNMKVVSPEMLCKQVESHSRHVRGRAQSWSAYSPRTKTILSAVIQPTVYSNGNTAPNPSPVRIITEFLQVVQECYSAKSDIQYEVENSVIEEHGF